MTEATPKTIFPHLRDRFTEHYTRGPESLRILRKELFDLAIGKDIVPVEVAINRALSLALYLGNTGYVAESRLAVQKVVDLAESEGYDMTRMPQWKAIESYMKSGGDEGEDSVMQDASLVSKQVSLTS